MLTNTFRHVPGIGLKTEKSFWAKGFKSWDDFRQPYPPNLPKQKIALINDYLARSKDELADNPHFFTELLTSNQHWRIFPHYRKSTVYFDIETTGLNDVTDHITTIATYDGCVVKTYVYGENLAEFVGDIDGYDVLVSYSGKTFDVPFVEKFFGIKIEKAHLDLRYILRGLGYSGGLKSCEKQLGIDRGDLVDVDGFMATLLWQEYKSSGDQRALETLLAYNVEDVVNLEALMVMAYNLSLQKTPFLASLCLEAPTRPLVPFVPDNEIIKKLAARRYNYLQNLY